MPIERLTQNPHLNAWVDEMAKLCNRMALDIYDSCAPSRGYPGSPPLALCVAERRKTEKWSPW